jgi:AraC family transcriptional regulator of arabinose operon
MRFAIRQRVQRAQQLLRGSSMQISEIADALGYVDVYFFSRQFKQATGVSPSTYRRDPSIGSDV